MTQILLFVILVIAGFVFREIGKTGRTAWAKFLPWPCWVASVVVVASISFVTIDQNSIGHLKRIYLGANMKPGQIIAFDGQKGPQARILGPGFHFIPLVRFLYKVEELPVVTIPQGSYGVLKAQDGRPLGNNQFIAQGWPDDKFNDMLNAEFFLKNGGQKGPQLTVLRPGTYRINRYLFDVKGYPALSVEAGQVAVVKSNVAERDDCPRSDAITHEGEVSESGAALSVPLVPKGCIGVWEEPLLPGRYYLNREAYTPTIIPTRAQTWVYAGGYQKRRIDLTVGDDGKIQQEAKIETLPKPEEAADQAIVVTVEGWRVPLDVRVVIQVDPAQAPRVVASVGGLNEVEDRIVTPALRSIVRNVGGAPGRRALDLINERDTLESLVEQAIFPEGLKAGVTIKEVRFGDPAIPPELLVARQRQQLADQLESTYERERVAQQRRVDVEKSRATADQQSELVRAQIAVQVAELEKEQLKLKGEGEKLRLIEIAKGQREQTSVLGEARVYQLAVLDKVLQAAVANPNIVKIPNVLVQGEGKGFEGPAAILGASNLMQSIGEGKKAQPPQQ
ncbi:MAG: SPFH domain-containing protein [Gammaproteobacteria bacterium]|nr:SPFH domain-containing protein [Gammaproteobacteria bacterium]